MTVITGKENIALARLATLRAALKLEIQGLSRRGRSAYAIIKDELGFRGSRKKVLAQLDEYIEKKEKDCGINR